jgi:hypothetical protein
MIRRAARRHMKPQRAPAPSVALMPADLEHRYRISNTTRQTWEREKKLPPRDFYVGDKPRGWLLETIMKAERGEYAAS